MSSIQWDVRWGEAGNIEAFLEGRRKRDGPWEEEGRDFKGGFGPHLERKRNLPVPGKERGEDFPPL